MSEPFPRVEIKDPGSVGAINVAGVTISLVVDETLPPGTVEMRSPGHAPVRMVNVAPDQIGGVGLDLPADCGPLIAVMLGGGERPPGAPYEHVHQFPEEPEDGPAPEYVPFTIERDAG